MIKPITKEWDKYIKRFTELPPDRALKAYGEGYYFEAVGVMHGFIESQLRYLLLAFSTVELDNPSEKIWNTNERLDLKNLSNILYVLQLITEKQFGVLNALNKLRNQVLHRYFYEPYDEINYGVSKKKFKSIIKPAYNLSYELMEKVDMIYEKGYKTEK